MTAALPAEKVRQIEGPTSKLPVQSEGTAVLGMIERVARDPSADMDKMMQLMNWRKEIVSEQKRAAFDEAMAAAKAEIPVIRKNRRVGFDTKGGDRTEYSHEDMGEIARTVDPILAKHGLSYRFRVSSEVNAPVLVTCIVSHRDGHFEETTLTAGRDDSGKKNAIQQVGSTITYLQRYTLKAALGLAAAADDDGRSSEQAEEEPYTPPPGSITEEQAINIREALEAKGASQNAFLQWAAGKGFFAGRKKLISEIPAERYDACMTAIAGFKKG
jgi:hypothetical protein